MVAEKEWTHHGLLLLPGLKQIGDWLDRERVNQERIEEGRIDEVKVKAPRTHTPSSVLGGKGGGGRQRPGVVAMSLLNVDHALVRCGHGLASRTQVSLLET